MKKWSQEKHDKLAKNLKLVRTAAGLTATDLGCILGVSRQMINNIERDAKMTKTVGIALMVVFDELSKNNETLRKTMDTFIEN